MLSQISFVVHGKSRRLTALVQEINQVFDSKSNLNVYVSSTSRTVRHCCVEAIENGAQVIVAVGGDGTLSEIVDTVMSAGKNCEVKVALFPNGSGNDFAKTIGAKPDLLSLKQSIADGKEIRCDVVELIKTDCEQNEPRFYINIADIGIGGEVAKFLHGKRKWLGPDITYLIATLKGFITYRKSFVTIKSKSFVWEGYTLGVVMANGKYFGSGLGIAPKASITDGMMDIVVLGEISLWDYFKQLGKVKRCESLHHPHVHYFKSEDISISSNKNMHIDVDGEYGGNGSLRCVVRPEALRVVVAS